MPLKIRHNPHGPQSTDYPAEAVEYIKPRTRRGHIVVPARIRLRTPDGKHTYLEAPGEYLVIGESGPIARYTLGEKPRARGLV